MGTTGYILIFFFCLHYTAGQDDVMQIQSVSSSTLRLIHNPALLEVAARFNAKVFLEFTEPEMTVVVQETVNVYFDCYPWAMNFPGGSIRWLIRSLRLTDTGLVERSPFSDATNQTRIAIGGVPPPDRWLNITGTIATEGASDPDYGDYRCEVCVARGTPEQICHNSTTRLFIAGAPPDVVEGVDNVFLSEINIPGTDRMIRTYQVGSDFCINRDDDDQYTIQCAVGAMPPPVPSDLTITWLKDGQEVATFVSTGTDRMINTSFFMNNTGNELFNPMAINPSVLRIGADNGLEFDFEVFNVTTVSGISMSIPTNQVRRMVADSFLGSWTCQAANVYGSDSESSVVRMCEGRPTFPGCEAGATAIFPSNGATVPIGCTICIPRGSSVTIDCNAMTPSDILSYTWTRSDLNISITTRRLTVTEEASYSCRASNLDFPNEMQTSVLVYSIALDFEAKITSTAGAQIQGSGCDRLRDDVTNTTDICVFIGEQVDITCINRETGERLDFTNSDGTVLSSGVQMVNDASFQSNYTCSLNTPDECGRVGRNLAIRVFDPARIDRTGAANPAGSLGVGRFTEVQRVANGDPVTLSCQTSGIDGPSTGWFFVNETSGCGMEIPVTDGVTTTAEGDSTLTIASYDGSSNDGTYVCRTENIAGRDAASIVISSVAQTVDWVADNNFGECSLMCRDGVRLRSVSCRSLPDGRLRPNSDCVAVNRPASAENCADRFPNECLLTPIYGTGVFSKCTKGCAGGYKSRDLFCFVPMTRKIVEMSYCSGQARPNRFLNCPNTCCNKDLHSACTRINPSTYCRLREVLRLCCWTCRNFKGFFPDDVTFFRK